MTWLEQPRQQGEGKDRSQKACKGSKASGVKKETWHISGANAEGGVECRAFAVGFTWNARFEMVLGIKGPLQIDDGEHDHCTVDMERGAVHVEPGLIVASIGNVDVDWFEDDESHTFKFNLPGLRTTDVAVQLVSENVLQVSGVRPGNRTPTAVAASGRWHVKERPTGAFRRTFQLPPDVSVRSASDVYAVDIDGVLVIKVPKRPLVRTIPVY